MKNLEKLISITETVKQYQNFSTHFIVIDFQEYDSSTK